MLFTFKTFFSSISSKKVVLEIIVDRRNIGHKPYICRHVLLVKHNSWGFATSVTRFKVDHNFDISLIHLFTNVDNCVCQ